MIHQGMASRVDEDSQRNRAECHRKVQCGERDIMGNMNVIVIDDNDDNGGTNESDLQASKPASSQLFNQEVIVIDDSD